ncbi:hypothetical protein DFJ73DRAFT_762438 [Zopfochytrium polystomum]|nr:hypothetical protein DFJ73DRAFT_762438 [Zopfochytrium polystomum]
MLDPGSGLVITNNVASCSKEVWVEAVFCEAWRFFELRATSKEFPIYPTRLIFMVQRKIMRLYNQFPILYPIDLIVQSPACYLDNLSTQAINSSVEVGQSLRLRPFEMRLEFWKGPIESSSW